MIWDPVHRFIQYNTHTEKVTLDLDQLLHESEQHLFVFQTIQSEQEGAKLNISSAVLERSRQLSETTEGWFNHAPVWLPGCYQQISSDSHD